jgi:hypothetical protein
MISRIAIIDIRCEWYTKTDDLYFVRKQVNTVRTIKSKNWPRDRERLVDGRGDGDFAKDHIHDLVGLRRQ